jgi:chromosome segregation ATPase
MNKLVNTVKDLIQDISSVQNAGQDLSESIARLQKALADSQEQVDTINHSIDEFKFKTQPRLEHIQQLQAKMQGELNKFE